MRSTLISPGDFHFLSPMLLEAQVIARPLRPADDERARSTKGVQQVWKTKYQSLAIASGRKPVARFFADLEVEKELTRQFETRSLT